MKEKKRRSKKADGGVVPIASREAVSQVEASDPVDREEREVPDPAGGDGGFWRWLPYGLLLLACLYCHGFILTNDGTIWDGWYWHEWIKARNWAPMLEYTGAQGLPFHLLLYGLYVFLPKVVVTGMALNFACLFLQSVFLYRIGLRFLRWSVAEAVGFAAVAGAFPLFNAAQDFPVIGLLLFKVLFLWALHLTHGVFSSEGQRHWGLRLASLLLFWVCCITNGALLVFYGGAYVLMGVRYRQVRPGGFVETARRFARAYPDYLLLPPVTMLLRIVFVKQYGWYETYNSPVGGIADFWPNLGTFFTNLLPYHARFFGNWIAGNLGLVLMFVVVLGLGVVVFHKRTRVVRSGLSAGVLGVASLGLMGLCVVPLAMVGKFFLPVPMSLHSRHCLLLDIPLGLLLFVALRALCFRGSRDSGVYPWAVAGCVLLLGVGLNSAYLGERMDWLFRRSALQQLEKHPAMEQSRVVLLQNFSSTGLLAYDLYGLASTCGGLTRYCTSLPPQNGKFYSPWEMYLALHMTSFIPNEFRGIDPSGQQIVVQVKRTRPGSSDWEAAWKDVWLRWMGTAEEVREYRARFTGLEVGLIKKAEPLVVGKELEWKASERGVPSGDFVNSVGMSMARTDYGWWAGRTEVTQAQYERVMGSNPSLFRDPVRPVECVNWNEAMEFCRRLSERERLEGRLPEGWSYRLPTVREWNFLALATDINDAAVSRMDSVLWRTEPVGQHKANPLGLLDVVGNVWEWCLDWADPNERFKVSRGGSWVDNPQTLAPYQAQGQTLREIALVASQRFFGMQRTDYPDQGFWDRGFRCVLAAPPELGAGVR